jgi:hypothetical protein
MKSSKRIASQVAATGEQQLAGFINRFDSKNAALIRSVRRVLRERLPTANELVYDNYNFFVIGYCSTDRPSDCILSIAAGANGVGLSFYYGATLPDPPRQRQPKPLYQDRVRGDAGASRGWGTYRRCHRAG